MKPLARYASLSSFVEVCRTFGVDPARLVRDSGLDPASITMQDRWVPAASIADVLERAATAAGRGDLGLRLAERRRLSNLGPLGMVIREEPDVRSALRLLTRYEHMYNEAVHTRLTEGNGLATIRIDLDLGEPAECRQSVEFAVGTVCRLLRDFLGIGWQPIAVGFTHGAPADPGTHHRVLGPTVRFDQEFDAITVYTSDLDVENSQSDPHLRTYAQQFLGSIEASKESTTLNRVRELIELLLPTGRCSVDQIARSLGVDRRTIHRRLAAEGHNFSDLLDSTRADLAARLVSNRRNSLTEVSEILAFSAPSNFTRWFRRRFGCSPTQWRNRDSA